MPYKKTKIINPLTGRQIQRGGKTHKKLLATLAYIDEVLTQDDEQEGGGLLGKLASRVGTAAAKGKTAQANVKKAGDFYENLLSKTRALDTPTPTVTGSRTDGGEEVNIPKSKYHLISSALPPNPEYHSWYHHHAPFSQDFGQTVCLQKSTLRELGLFLRDSLLSDVA